MCFVWINRYRFLYFIFIHLWPKSKHHNDQYDEINVYVLKINLNRPTDYLCLFWCSLHGFMYVRLSLVTIWNQNIHAKSHWKVHDFMFVQNIVFYRLVCVSFWCVHLCTYFCVLPLKNAVMYQCFQLFYCTNFMTVPIANARDHLNGDKEKTISNVDFSLFLIDMKIDHFLSSSCCVLISPSHWVDLTK